MKKTLVALVCLLLFVLGAGSLALTLYLWFGDWPAEVKSAVDHYRSVAEQSGNRGDPLITNVFARKTLDLGGRWPAVIDPYGRGDLGGIAARAMEPRTPSDLSEFSYENGLELEVPGDWNTQDPRLVFYQGVVWYKRSFDHRAQAGRRYFLHFGAVHYIAQVYLNGELIGIHRGGFTPFNYEVGAKLREGENLLVVRVDNRKTDEDIPTPMTDWLNYGGITREVQLVDLPERFVRSYQVGLARDRYDAIGGHVVLDGGGAGQRVSIRIDELGVALKTSTDEAGRASFEVEARPELWSPDSPRLYTVVIEGAGDRVEDEIGFRRIEAEGKALLLNGEPIFLRGICLHEEAPGKPGRAFSEAHAEVLLGWAEELGANFVRLAHYPHNEHMVRAADRKGLLVWAEIPVYWAVDFGNPDTLALGRAQLTELIERDRNRASVIFWSLANETPVSEDRQDFLQALADHARALDDSRLLTAAMVTGPEDLGAFLAGAYLPALLGVGPDEWIYPVTDPVAEIVDVPSLNEYFGWYYSGALGLATPFTSHYARRVMLEGLPDIRLEADIDKPMILSELGAGARAGMHAPEDELAVFTEEYQALVYRKQIEMIRRQEGLVGLSPWILKDFRSPLRMYQGVQDYWNLKGLVSDEGQKKQAFGVLRDYYTEIRDGRPGPSG